jgi:hypothetical protein
MNRDTSGGAVHGLGKRGTGVSMADHGCAGEEPEGLAQNLAPQVLAAACLYKLSSHQTPPEFSLLCGPLCKGAR